MQLSLRPWITASVALTGAAFFVVPPAAAPLSEVHAQHRQVSLKSYDEYDLSQLASTTTTNIDALESYFSSNPFLTSPDVAQGFSTLLTDIFTGQSNPVTNPLSVLAEGSLGLLSSGYGFNAASSAFTGVIDNVQAALSSDNFSAALTDLENGPTTVLYAALNGYPETVGSGLLSPEFGLLTSPAGDGLATGTLYAVNQIETTLANELSALGGGGVTTGSLPEVTGTVDLSVSVDQAINDILNALGFSSGGGVLTVNQLLTDLGLDPAANLLPSVDIGDVLSLLHLSDSSGISLGSILSGLNLSDSSGISLGSILSDLHLSDGSGISLGSILSDLNLSDNSSISLPDISVGTILSDLGFSDSTGISIPSISIGTILNDLGYSDSTGISIPSISLGTILADLGYSDTSSISIPDISIPVTTILHDLGVTNLSGNITLSVPSISIPDSTILSELGLTGNVNIPLSTIVNLLGNPSINLGITHISLSTFLSDAGLGSSNVSIPLSTIFSDLGINTGNSLSFNVPSLTIPISTILTDLNITNTSGDLTFSVPSINLGDVLSALHLSDSTTITPPDINLGDVLSVLGINDGTTITPPDINLGDVLGFLGLTDSSTITPPDINLGDVLSTLGLNDTDTITLGDVLNTLGINDTDTITLGDVLNTLGINDTTTITLGDVLNTLGLNDTSTLGLGSVLNALGLSDSTTIPLPSFSLDNVLTDLGISPTSSIDSLLTQLGIPDTLTLSPTLDLTGSGVPLYDLNLSQDLLAAIGSIQSLSSDLPSLLTPDPTLDLVPLLSGLVGDLGVPFSITGGDLAANLTNVLAEVLPTLF